MEKPKENKSYNAIMASAKTLFWKHGISRITVEEICRDAGVSKMTFYRLFQNKIEVAEKVLDDSMEEGMQQYRSIMKQRIHYPEKMKQIIALKQESSTDISEEFLKDIYQNEELGLIQRMKEYTNNCIVEVIEDYKVAQQEGWIRQNLKLEFIMYINDQLTKALLDENLISMYSSPQEAIMEVTNFFFYGILSNKERTSE